MDANSSKALDEACNHNNDCFDDEVLYSSWAETPRVKAGSSESAVSAYVAAARTCVQTFMTRLYATQESALN